MTPSNKSFCSMAKRIRRHYLTTLIILSLGFGIVNGQPRTPAEWEEVQGVIMEAELIINWPDLRDEALEPFIKVAEVCIAENIDFYLLDPPTNTVDFDTVFANRGISSPLIHIFDEQGFLFPYVRDIGPFSIYENGVGQLSFAGFPDDVVASLLANELDYPFVALEESFDGASSYDDGGNHLVDGHGELTIKNRGAFVPNGLVESFPEYRDKMGIANTLHLTGVDIHVDYWLKMINEETFVVSYIPSENLDPIIDDRFDWQDTIAANIDYLQSTINSTFGRQFEFIPIRNAPTFDDVSINTTYLSYAASYVNSLFLNNTILVPQFAVEPYDSDALAAYAEALPGYNVVGLNCRSYATGAGAIHCLTREIYADNPIYFKHAWLKDTVDATTGYPIETVVRSQIPLASVDVFWSTSPGGPYSAEQMLDSGNDIYLADIPEQPQGSTIYYYLSATNTAGKTITKPFVAPGGHYEFVVGTTTSIAGDTPLPASFTLRQNYPNPFNPMTTIAFELTAQMPINLTVFNARGQVVTSLVERTMAAGKHTVQFDGSSLSSGIYFARLQSDRASQAVRMMLIK
jgi:agmatine deiminase